MAEVIPLGFKGQLTPEQGATWDELFARAEAGERGEINGIEVLGLSSVDTTVSSQQEISKPILSANKADRF